MRKTNKLGKQYINSGFFSTRGPKWCLQGVFNDRENYTKILNKTKTGIQTHNLCIKGRLNNNMLSCNNSLFGITVKNLENTEKLKKTIIMGTCKTSIIRAKTDELKG